ncbi:hypothetical protein ACKUFN_27095, partial [Escherichia coli]|uniref:hypothetical protein n=1 Tax=Escherichia coli TaxID=562 RepID=UPI00390C539F
PTIGRESIYLSIDSVISQTYKVTDIIICYDGNVFEKLSLELNSYYTELINKKIIKILNVGPFSGGNVARQRGIEVSKSR